MESLYSMSACGHLESSSSTHSPSYPCSWNTSPIPGRLDVFMTLDARFTMPFISGILLQNGGNICLGWGVLIFHAYGHQWACQLWYHPCKDTLWGLLDGEGCERFWSKLCHLISGLCVTGYHCHLFVLDMQIKHITTKKHFQLPRWVKEHLQCAESQLNSATEELGSQSIEELLSHFDSQCQHHSAPPGCQSKSAIQSLIESVISLKATCEMKEGILKEILQD